MLQRIGLQGVGSQGIGLRARVLAVAVALIAALGLATAAYSQQPADGAAGAESAEAKSETAAAEVPPKEPKKPRGRLPLYFAKVVTSEQREKIYGIQATYQEQIDALMAQLRELETKRDADVHAVLTPEQQKQVADMMEEARKRRTALREAGTSGEAAGASGEQ